MLVEGDKLLPAIVGNATTLEKSRPSATKSSSANQLAMSKGGVFIVIVLSTMLFI